MPAVIDNAVAFLIADSLAWKQHYADGVFDSLKRFGKTTQWIPSRKRVMQGTSIEYTVRRYHAHAATVTMDPMAPYGNADYAKTARFYVNFDYTAGGTNNDFMKIEVPFRTTHYDLKKVTDGTYKDKNFLQENIEQGMADVKEKVAKQFHLPSDGRLATIKTSGIKNDDSDIFRTTTSYTSGSTACMVQLDPCSAGIISEGELIEIRTSTGILRANYVRVTNRHPFDNTISISLTSDSVNESAAAVANFDAIAAGDYIYLNGGYNVVAKGSLDHFFTPSSTYYGRDRLDPEYHILQGKRIDVSNSGTGVQLTADHFRYVGEVAAWANYDANAVVPRRACVMSRNEYRGVAKILKDEEIRIAPSRPGEPFNRAFGYTGQVLYDPNLGEMMFIIDDFAKYGKIDFLEMDNGDEGGWEMVTPFDGGFEMLPGTYGFWSRVAENDGSGQLSLRYEANGFQLYATVCTNARKQIRMDGLATDM